MITPLSEGIVNKSDGPKHPTHVAGPGDKDWAEIPGLGVIWHASSEEPDKVKLGQTDGRCLHAGVCAIRPVIGREGACQNT